MSAKLRVIFAGTPVNAATTLGRLHEAGVNIVGVLTRKDSLVGRSKALTVSPVAAKADELDIDVFKSNSMDRHTLDWVRSMNADVGVVVAYGTIFREEELGIPRLGWLNLHYSLLPELPGPAPVQHALLEGRTKTGVTVFRIDKGIDTGPVVKSEAVEILDTDTSGTLLSRLTAIGSATLADVILGGESIIEEAVPQQGVGSHPTAFKPGRDTARLDFSLDARMQLDKIRAMNPEPMAWFEHNLSPVRVVKASLVENSSTDPSLARIANKQLIVDCFHGSLVFETVQPAGKKEMSGADWFRGLRVEKLKLS